MYKQIAETNAANLKSNAYPGRGIVLGATEDGRKLAQIYWIMGRSENSRNRVFQEESGFVRTRAFDESKLTDP
ncbi:MAG TPA: IMP cyclohydrolase, partial [Thermoclostridium caenicola]|nr:IMP cyclohydrolase [Thermoclostridium caenicola]